MKNHSFLVIYVTIGLLMGACSPIPATYKNTPQLTSRPTAQGMVVLVLKTLPPHTAVPTRTTTPTAVPTDTATPTQTEAGWVDPNLQPGENPACHEESDWDNEIYAHLAKTDDASLGCFIKVTTTAGYRRLGIYRIDGGLEKVIDVSWDENQSWSDTRYKYNWSDGFYITLSFNQQGFWIKSTNDDKNYIVKQNWAAAQIDLLDYLP